MSWGVRSKQGVVTIAPSEKKARAWAAHDFKGRIGEVGEKLVRQDPATGEWIEQVEL